MSDEKNEVVVADEPGGQLAESKMAVGLGEHFGASPQSIINLIRNQIIAVPQGKPKASGAEAALVMSVMHQYKLDPFARMVSAWRDNKGKLCIAVEQNGWVKMAKDQPGYLRPSYKYGNMVESPDGRGKKCWEWVQVTIHDSLLGDVECPPVYLDEWYVKQSGGYPGNWQKYTKFRLCQRALNIGLRTAYGISVYDEFDRERMDPVLTKREAATDATQKAMDTLTATLAATSDVEPEDAEFEDVVKATEGSTDLDEDLPEDATSAAPDGPEAGGDTPEEGPEPAEASPGADDDVKVSPRSGLNGSSFCSVASCSKHGGLKCSICGQAYCSQHMGEDGKCRICEH